MSIATCAFSGQPLKEAVVSAKTGHVFERRVIEQHLTDTGQCPITGVEMNPKTDLIELQVPTTALPRPMEATSVPGALSLLQSEWDGHLLETYNLRKSLNQCRQELAHALYQQDAACRVIARLLKEKEGAEATSRQAKEDLATAQIKIERLERQLKEEGSSQKVEENKGKEDEPKKAQSSEAANVQDKDNEKSGAPKATLDPAICLKLEENCNKLMEYRKNMKPDEKYPSKGALPKTQLVQTYKIENVAENENVVFDLSHDDSLILACYQDSTGQAKAHWYNRIEKKVINEWNVEAMPKFVKVHYSSKSECQQGLLFYEDKIDITGPGESAIVSLPISASFVTFNTLGEYCAIAQKDQMSWTFLELGKSDNEFETKVISSADDGKITAMEFHPDGLLLTTGHESGVFNIWDIRSSKLIKQLKPYKDDPIKSISISSRGYYFACASSKQNSAKLFDIRKQFAETEITWGTEKTNELVDSISFDSYGTYLFVATKTNLRLFAAKKWQDCQAKIAHEGAHTWSFSQSSYLAIGFKDQKLVEYAIKQE